jgi:hypothetical protein
MSSLTFSLETEAPNPPTLSELLPPLSEATSRAVEVVEIYLTDYSFQIVPEHQELWVDVDHPQCSLQWLSLLSLSDSQTTPIKPLCL